MITMFLIGCSSETIDDTEDETKATEKEEVKEDSKEDMMESFKTMSDAIESGKPTKCTISYSNPEMEESMNIVYWLKGEDMRMETTMEGMSSVVVVKDEMAYTQANSMMGDTDCDWMSLDMSETTEEEGPSEYGSEEDFDYAQYEDDSTYSVECSPESFSNSKFDISGKVCSMEDLMEEMMAGFN